MKTYVYYWVDALIRARGADSVRLFPALRDIGECFHERSAAGPIRTLAGLVLLHAANATRLPLLNMMQGFDVFHASHQLISPPRNRKITATLYDMTCWLVPEMHSRANVAAAKRFAELVLRRADGLIAISENTKRDAVRVLDLNPDRIHVIYPGVAEGFFHAKPLQRTKPYALFVGTIEPRKNVAALLDAWEGLPQGVRDEFDLVIAGPPGWGESEVMNRLREGIPGVVYLGYVAEEELPGLTAGAVVFVYPSFYEGFGLPVAQAMASGVPVITSTTSCLPEVVGEGGILIDPRSARELKEALYLSLTGDSTLQRRGELGRRRAQKFRWRASADNAWFFYDQLAG